MAIKVLYAPSAPAAQVEIDKRKEGAIHLRPGSIVFLSEAEHDEIKRTRPEVAAQFLILATGPDAPAVSEAPQTEAQSNVEGDAETSTGGIDDGDAAEEAVPAEAPTKGKPRR